jgi:hypothetical protein
VVGARSTCAHPNKPLVGTMQMTTCGIATAHLTQSFLYCYWFAPALLLSCFLATPYQQAIQALSTLPLDLVG